MSPTHDAYKKKVRYIVSYKTYIQAEILLKKIMLNKIVLGDIPASL